MAAVLIDHCDEVGVFVDGLALHAGPGGDGGDVCRGWVAIAVEFAVFRRFFGRDLAVSPTVTAEAGEPLAAPWFAIVTVAATLAGFVAASAAGVNPAWAAAAGAVVLAVTRRRAALGVIVGAADLPFLAFVLALAVVLRAVINNGLDTALRGWLPHGDGPAAMLGVAAVAAVASNLVNNLPAVVVLLPLTTAGGPAAMLAVLIGVNIGPNLTYAGSLATMLWRRVPYQHNHPASLGESSPSWAYSLHRLRWSRPWWHYGHRCTCWRLMRP